MSSSSPTLLGDGSAPEHQLICSDNLPALIALADSGVQPFDVIYIDPPYNTGANLTYRDRRADWTEFMRPRLAAGLSLLATDGVLFISIDEDHLLPLRALMDALLGEQYLLGQFAWHKTRKGKALSAVRRPVLDYVLAYSPAANRPLYGARVDASVKSPLTHGPNNPRTLVFPAGIVHLDVPDQVVPAGWCSPAKDPLAMRLDKPVTITNGVAGRIEITGRFRWTQDTLNAHIAAGTRFEASLPTFKIRFQRHDIHSRWKSPRTLWDETEGVGTNEQATAELAQLIGPGRFTYPKPVSLISYIITCALGERTDGRILDFFAGSATTLHAALALNAADSGSREAIVITNNEQGIFANVAVPRINAVLTSLPGSVRIQP